MGIGRKTRLLTDESRSDFYSNEAVRRIPISIFYPTRQEGSSLYKDLYAPRQEMLVKIYGEGNKDRIRHLEGVATRFINGAAPDRDRTCPVIVFSHGLEADRDFYLFLIEPLVDEGYIVVTTGHLYDTDVTLLPNGEIVEMKPGLLGESTYEQRRDQIETRGRDMSFVVDYLKELSEDPEFQGMLDLQKVALCGHSLGGMTVLETLDHPLVKAGVMLDAAVSLIDVEKKLENNEFVDKPVLNMRRYNITYEGRVRSRIQRLRDKGPQRFQDAILKEHDEVIRDEKGTADLFRYVKGRPENFILIKDTVHMTFCDWFALVTDKYIPGLLPLEKAYAIITGAVTAFFRENLLQDGEPYKALIRENREPDIEQERIRLP